MRILFPSAARHKLVPDSSNRPSDEKARALPECSACHTISGLPCARTASARARQSNKTPRVQIVARVQGLNIGFLFAEILPKIRRLVSPIVSSNIVFFSFLNLAQGPVALFHLVWSILIVRNTFAGLQALGSRLSFASRDW